MEDFVSSVKSVVATHPYVSGIVAGTSVYVFYRQFLRGPKKLQIKNVLDTVVLYQFSRGPYAPSMSNYALKLETYLRMANIPYVADLNGQMSSKGKIPWISYNRQPVADSQFSIEFLNKTFGIDLNKDLTKEQRGAAKAIQVMVDEHLDWAYGYFRCVNNSSDEVLKMAFPSFIFRRLVRIFAKKKMQGQGIGRHTEEEIQHIMMTELQALSDFLGDKPFMMGQSACEVDCSVFGVLAQFVWHGEGTTANIVQDQFPNLHKFCLRMKDKFWPDWNECITEGSTQAKK